MGTIALVMKWYDSSCYEIGSFCYEIGTIALVMKWYDSSCYQIGTIAFVMK